MNEWMKLCCYAPQTKPDHTNISPITHTHTHTHAHTDCHDVTVCGVAITTQRRHASLLRLHVDCFVSFTVPVWKDADICQTSLITYCQVICPWHSSFKTCRDGETSSRVKWLQFSRSFVRKKEASPENWRRLNVTTVQLVKVCYWQISKASYTLETKLNSIRSTLLPVCTGLNSRGPRDRSRQTDSSQWRTSWRHWRRRLCLTLTELLIRVGRRTVSLMT